MARPAPVRELEQGALFAESYVWDKPDEVRRVNVDTARSWIERWHYSHTMPGGGTIIKGAKSAQEWRTTESMLWVLCGTVTSIVTSN